MDKREYIKANKDWLEAKAKEEGVKALPKGIYYKVLSEGNQDSSKPTARSIITAHYTGKTIDGKQFDSSRGGVPLACRLCDLIEGWIIAMQQMHIGDKWEIYIPAEMGYGKFSQPGIPVISGRYTFLPKWAMANSLNRASLVALHLSLKLNC